MNDKIHKALGIFLDAMRPFIVSFLETHFPNSPWEGEYFARLKAPRQATWNQASRAQGKDAPRINFIDYNNMPDFAIGFKRELSTKFGSTDKGNKFISYLQELKDIRNKCNHYQDLTDVEIDATFVYIKQAAIMLEMMDLVEEMDNIKNQGQTYAQVQYEPDAPAETPKHTFGKDDAPIPAWYTNVYPHYDIRNGVLDESIFAANLWEVALGTGKEVYLNSTMFFEKTYITAGLKDIINRVVRALNGTESENRVVSLQTGFGGGKTHMLISLYHVAKAGRSLLHSAYTTNLLQEGLSPDYDQAHVAVFTDNTTDVEQGRIAEEGIIIHTLWGEIAYQLGGKEAYEKVRANDEKRIAPSAIILKSILQQYTPSLILIDELANYCNRADGYKVGGGTLYTQTLSFMQALTEAVASVPRCVLIATLPASATEISSSEKGQEILTALENRIVRIGTGIKPVDDEEIFEVVRRRLFENVGNPEVITQVLDRYKKTYHNRRSDLPSEADRMEYISKMRKSYPFHPELIDMFRLKWGNDSRFQRTRGVLRLLASIVKDLWNRRGSLTGSQAMIHTSDVNLANLPTLTGTITSLMGSQWETVMHADIIGTSSNAYKIDNEDPSSNTCKYQLAQGIATTLLLSSIGGSQSKGLTMDQLKLCMLRPSAFQHSEINNALNKLEQVAYYLYSSSVNNKQYWFQAKPNINILINSAKSEISVEEVKGEILKRLNAQLSSNSQLRILVNPTGDVPEQKTLTLVVLSPDYTTQVSNISKKVENFVEQLSTRKGNSQRIYRNTIFYLTCSENQLGILQGKLTEYLACQKVQTEYSGQLDVDQKRDIIDKKNEANTQADAQLISVYNIVLRYSVTDGMEAVELRDFARTMQAQVTEKLIDAIIEEEWLIRSIGLGTLKSNHLYPTIEQPVNVASLYEAFLQYDDKPMITDANAVINTVKKFCMNGEFNVAFGEEGNYTRIYHKEDVWGLDVADRQYWLVDKSILPKPKEDENSEGQSGNYGHNENDGNNNSGGSTNISGGSSNNNGNSDIPTVRNFKSIRVSGKVPIEQWTQLFTSFVTPLCQNNLEIEVSFKAKSTSAQPLNDSAQVYKSVKESAQQLGLKLEEEE